MQAAGGEGEVAVDEAEEAAVDEQLHELRRQIAAAKHLGELAGLAGLWAGMAWHGTRRAARVPCIQACRPLAACRFTAFLPALLPVHGPLLQGAR